MTSWETCDAVERHPDKVSGAWVFRGTRVPVSTLFENLKDGASIEQFLSGSPPHQPRQPASVQARQRPLPALHAGRAGD